MVQDAPIRLTILKLIKEFYEDYRLKEEYKKGFTICIKKLITINFKKK